MSSPSCKNKLPLLMEDLGKTLKPSGHCFQNSTTSGEGEQAVVGSQWAQGANMLKRHIKK